MTPPEWLSALPEEIRANEVLTGFQNVEALARGMIDAKTGDWKVALPEDIRADASLSTFKGIPELARSFIETKKLVGQKGVTVPGENATDQEWAAFHRSIGTPESADGYKISMPAGLSLPESEIAQIRADGHRLGLSGRQVQAIINERAQFHHEVQRAIDEDARKADVALREKWGGNYERNKAYVERALKGLDPEGNLVQFFTEAGYGSNVGLLDALVKLARGMQEHGLIAPEVSGVATRDEALRRIAEMQADPKHPYHKSKAGDPIHQEFVQLFQVAYD